MGREKIQYLRGESTRHAHALDTVFIFESYSHACIISGEARFFKTDALIHD
jgi:hypothetical protein